MGSVKEIPPWAATSPCCASSFQLVTEREPEVTSCFSETFFNRYPQVKPLFTRNSPEKQPQILTEALVAVMDHLEDAPWLED